LEARDGQRGRRKPPRLNRVSSLPTASGGIARAAYARAVRAGLEIRPLLQNAGLTLHQIQTPSVRIPVRSQIKFLEQIANGLRDDFLGIHLAQDVDLRELGLVYYVLASSETLATALARLARYSTIHNEGVHLNFNQQRSPAVSFEYIGVARASDRHQIEFFVAILLRLCRHLIDRHVAPRRVHLAHRRSRIPTDLKMFFGCDVEFGAGGDQLIFPPGAGNSVVAQADPYLNSLLLKYCEEVLSSRRTGAADWTTRVENAITPLLPHGEATIGNVAQGLGMSPRTLARHLRHEGVNFATVLQNLRLQLAHQYFREPGVNIAQLGWLLGYKEPSAFSHAFKRWTGIPPRRFVSGAPFEGDRSRL
jgi:AraC-like DNA-binding protein